MEEAGCFNVKLGIKILLLHLALAASFFLSFQVELCAPSPRDAAEAFLVLEIKG